MARVASEPPLSLAAAFTCLVTGSSPGRSAADVASLISRGVRGLAPGEDREARRRSPSEDGVDATCLALTLVDRITWGVTSRSLSPAAAVYCTEVLEVLLQELQLMAHVTQLFQTEDLIVSHLAAKTASACVFYQLLQPDGVCPVWQQQCVQVFCSSAPGPALDASLWSLTEVLKQLLKGAHADVLMRLLAALDFSLNALCSRFLPEEEPERPEEPEDLDLSDRRWATSCCLLLELLEVLTASGLSCCGDAVLLQSQRATHLRAAPLLAAVSRSPRYFVKRRALLLLKRAVLQTAGEDWALGGGRSRSLLHADTQALARAVLTAVADDWLQSVQVESASYFGGTGRDGGDGGQKPDGVVLRAVSLLLLKSVELHVQSAGAAGVGGATEALEYLQRLWGFLRRCSVQLTERTHRCCWVSLLLADQDDDMLQAAGALFSIFLHHRRRCGLEDAAALEAACASGCNPHCLFLLLLQSVSFDHSILLDFLISSETCFLEYLVRYLKYLRADRRGFAAACGRVGRMDGHASGAADPPAVPVCATAASPVGSVRAGFPLVEYDSSDPSDAEDMEVSPEGASACESGGLGGPLMPVGQQQSEPPVSEHESTLDRRREGPSLQSEPAACSASACSASAQPGDVSARALRCMSELRAVVTRLQAKKLFPYNPSCLLKLLAEVERCCELTS
ncbi:protein Lines homolog 1 [Clinocottus analis]|uniref:protein Lines homolog 1 n=1 Tax=Clinocottus analis TaxID=304258 RepID=UPI0035C08E90